MHRTLTEAGLPDRQAEAILKVMQGGVVTRQDLDHVRSDLSHEIDRVRIDLGNEIDRARTDLGNEIGRVRLELRHEIDLVRTDLVARVDKLDNKVNLILGGVVLAVLAPAIARLIVG